MENMTSVVWEKYSTTFTIDHFGVVVGDLNFISTLVEADQDLF